MTKLKNAKFQTHVLHFSSIEPGQKNIFVTIFRLNDPRFFLGVFPISIHTFFQQIYSTKTAKARVVSTLASLLWAGAILNNQPSFDLTESSIITYIQLHSQFNCADQSSRRSVRRFRRSGLKHMHTVGKQHEGKNNLDRSRTSSTNTALFS